MKRNRTSRRILICLSLASVLVGCVGDDPFRPPTPSPPIVPRPEGPGTWNEAAPIPARVYDSGVVVFRDHVYVLGGWIGDGVEGTEAVYRFDPATGWERLTDLPLKVAKPQPVVVGDSLYVAAGLNGFAFSAREPVLILWVYDPDRDAWASRAGLPDSRRLYRAVGIDGKILLIGGTRSESASGDLVAVFDLATSTWSYGAPIPSPRVSPGVHVIDGEVWVLGGAADEAFAVPMNDVLAYDPVMDSWRTVPVTIPTATFEFASAVRDGEIHLVGGAVNDGSRDEDLHHAYGLATDEWATYHQLPAQRRQLGAVEIDGRIYALGGFKRSEGAKSEVWWFDP